VPTLSKRVGVLQESAIRKLDMAVTEHPDVHFHRLNIGQPDVATPEPLLDAIASWRPKVIAYGPASGLPACREAGAEYHRAWCPELNWKHVAATVGGSEALLFAFTALCDPGDELLVPEPYYTNYNGFATVAGAKVMPIPTSIAQDFAIPPDDVLDRYVTPRTRALVFSNPSNPTGAVYGAAEVERLLAWAKRHDIFVIADEVYRRIYFDEPPASALSFDEYADRVILIDSMSKTYSACGLRLGFLISRNMELMEKVDRLGQARLGPQPLSQAVAIAALQLPEHYYATVRQTYKARVDALLSAVRDIEGVTTSSPKGAFYCMLGLPVDSAEDFARFLITDFRLDGESVVVAPGPGFYADPTSGRSEIRLAAVTHEESIARAGHILAQAIGAYQNR
jgi:aspartate aminotransferase